MWSVDLSFFFILNELNTCSINTTNNYYIQLIQQQLIQLNFVKISTFLNYFISKFWKNNETIEISEMFAVFSG